jgi:cytoskeletal protein CcmA (bactofilin family)
MSRWRHRPGSGGKDKGSSNHTVRPEPSQPQPVEEDGDEPDSSSGGLWLGSRPRQEVRMARGDDDPEVSVVGRGAKIEGTVIAAGSLKVEGEVKGAITAKGDVSLSPEGRVEANIEGKNITLAGQVKGDVAAAGQVSLPANSRLEGNIRGQDVDVGGVVGGNIEASGRVHLGRQAHVEGDISAKSLGIEEGAVFSGRSVMGEKKVPPAEQFAAPSSIIQHVPRHVPTGRGDGTAGQGPNLMPQEGP